jgi:hypothetical protein
VSYCIAYERVIIGTIGEIKPLDEILLKEYPFVKNVYSNTQEKMIIANTCVHCGALQGNFFIFDEILHYVDKDNMDKQSLMY